MSANLNQINEITTALIKHFGRTLAEIGEFEPEMVVLEGLAAALITFTAHRYNKQPDQLVAAFCDGVKERVDKLIYGATH